MDQDKDAHRLNKKSKGKSKDALAEKGGNSLKTNSKDPLMKIEGKETPSESKNRSPEVNEKAEKSYDQLDLEELKSTLGEKNRLAEEYYDRLLRTQAEFENYKKRTEKELCEFKIYANAQLVKDLLGILDDLQTALASEEKGSNEKFREGIELIYKNFYGMLEKEGLSTINPVHEKFDPWKHEAVEMVPTNDHPEHTVLGVIQPGYKFKDKILRPAKVRVATLPSSEAENVENEEVEEDLKKVEGKNADKNNAEEND